MDLGTLRVAGEIKLGARSRQYIPLSCEACGVTRELLVDNLLGEKTRNCRCQRGVKYRHPEARLIGARYDAVVRRCTNPADPAYSNYGAIGIECRFPDRQTFVEHVLSELPRDSYIGLQIDRVDNDGHYEPGNLRLVRPRENLRNKSTNRRCEYQGQTVVAADVYDLIKRDHPHFELSRGTTAKLAAAGVRVEDILLRRPRPKRR
jgi:hypothetical protein